MRRYLAWVSNSIVARVVIIVICAANFGMFALATLLQTPIGGRVLDRAIELNSDSIAELVWLIENSPAEIEVFVLSTYNSTSRVARISDSFGPALRANTHKQELFSSGTSDVVDRLRTRDIRFRTIGFFQAQQQLSDEDLPPLRAASLQQIAIRLSDDRVLSVWLAPSVSLSVRPNVIIVTTIGLILLVILLSFALYVVITSPIRQLERDAEHVGLATTSVRVSEEGPRELRRLSAALNRMRARLARLIHEREQIIVAIAHDIATGLTRLRLRMDERPHLFDPEFEADLAQMDNLASEMMAYARAENPLVEPELIDLGELAHQIAVASPCRVERVWPSEADFTIAGNTLALRRLFENLIENARRYGRGTIIMRLTVSDEGLEIAIEDDGDGIPEDDLERVFEPFYRREASRNRSTGGTGLGLGIARAIAQTHGATISLENRSAGGLAARVFFPLALAQ